MIENKQYIIFDMNEKIDSLLLADLKAYGYKLTHIANDLEEGQAPIDKSDELFDALNKVFHYKGHRKPQVLVVTDKADMLAAAEEMEIDAFSYESNPEVLREALIDEAELQAIREGAKMPKDGPTSIYVRGKDGKGDGEKRTNAMAVVWAFLYPYLVFYFLQRILWDVGAIFVKFLAGTSKAIHKFVYGFMVVGETSATPNGSALIQIPTLLLSALIVYLVIGGKKALKDTKEEAQDLNIKNVIICTGITLVMALGLNFCFYGFGLLQKDPVYVEYAQSTNEILLPIGLILFGVVVPFVEELVYRGIIFNAVKGLVKPLFAATVSAALFAFGHAGFLNCVYAFVIGFMFAYTYHHTNKFFIPVIMHSIINIVVYLLGKAEVFKENTTLAIVGLACAVLSAGVLYFKKERP